MVPEFDKRINRMGRKGGVVMEIEEDERLFSCCTRLCKFWDDQPFLILKTTKYAGLHTQSSKVSTVLGKSVFSLFVWELLILIGNSYFYGQPPLWPASFSKGLASLVKKGRNSGQHWNLSSYIVIILRVPIKVCCGFCYSQPWINQHE